MRLQTILPDMANFEQPDKNKYIVRSCRFCASVSGARVCICACMHGGALRKPMYSVMPGQRKAVACANATLSMVVRSAVDCSGCAALRRCTVQVRCRNGCGCGNPKSTHGRQALLAIPMMHIGQGGLALSLRQPPNKTMVSASMHATTSKAAVYLRLTWCQQQKCVQKQAAPGFSRSTHRLP